jgi:TPR repeat protein
MQFLLSDGWGQWRLGTAGHPLKHFPQQGGKHKGLEAGFAPGAKVGSMAIGFHLRACGSGIFKAIQKHPCSPIKLEGFMHDLMMTAIQGDAAAAYQLGYLFETGDGVPQDEKEALPWYLMGAQKGHSKAQFNLAVMLDEGRGQTPDMRKAFHWYEKAAQQGESNAQYNLALFCTLGKGCEVNLVLAHMWFAWAARKGSSDAIHKRDAVAKQLKAEQLSLSQQWVAQWIEKHSAAKS